MYLSTKTYGAERGLSACFRQWRADSHCNQLHGYALAFTFTFEAAELDERNWVVDFGSLHWLKAWLEGTFDHTCLVARNDPQAHTFRQMQAIGIADIRWLDKVGCEAFAELAARYVNSELRAIYGNRVELVSVECREHAGNSAIWMRDGYASKGTI